MLPWVCSVIDHRGRQNMVKTSVTLSPTARVPLLCFYHILTSPPRVVYYRTDTWQHRIYLNVKQTPPYSDTRENHSISVRWLVTGSFPSGYKLFFKKIMSSIEINTSFFFSVFLKRVDFVALSFCISNFSGFEN